MIKIELLVFESQSSAQDLQTIEREKENESEKESEEKHCGQTENLV